MTECETYFHPDIIISTSADEFIEKARIFYSKKDIALGDSFIERAKRISCLGGNEELEIACYYILRLSSHEKIEWALESNSPVEHMEE